MSTDIDLAHIKRLWMLLHGMYGNLLFDKYRTGDVDDEGQDKGVLSAMTVWLNGLQQFDFNTIRRAVARCEDKHKTYPPSLPEFRDLCKSLAPRAVKPLDVPQLTESEENKAERRAMIRRTLDDLRMDRLYGERKDYGTGLRSLLAMISKASADAGGDEAIMLTHLEHAFRPRPKAPPHRGGRK